MAALRLPPMVALNIAVCNAAPLDGLIGEDDTLASAIPSSLSARLIPVHSPLLGESLLLSFPPLSNMLKFSG